MFGKNEMSGKMKLAKLLKTGEQLHIFTFDKEQLDIFRQEAEPYGMAYSLVKRSDEDKAAGTYTLLCREKDVERVLGSINLLERISDLPGADRSEITSFINEQLETKKLTGLLYDMVQQEYQSSGSVEFEELFNRVMHEQETERS